MPSEATVAAFVVFCGAVRIAAGALPEVAVEAKRANDRDRNASVLVFDSTTGAVRDLDLRGSETEIVARYAPERPLASGRGRPKLGVVAREVTLLPRHWTWLSGQPGGASVALRKLVEAARKAEDETGLMRARVEAAYRFMSTMAGDFPGFEEASRALFANDQEELARHAREWPPDIRNQVFRYLSASSQSAGV